MANITLAVSSVRYQGGHRLPRREIFDYICYGCHPYLKMDYVVMPRKTDKRVRLIEAAKKLIHQQGFSLTTLADIAQAADVPLGNVYYYFKTKDAIGTAVIEKLQQEWVETLNQFATDSDPLARLFVLLHDSLVDLDNKARYGCNIGGLCQELGKQGGPLADMAAKILFDTLHWVEAQFSSLGFEAQAQNYALHLVSSIQGMHLLAHTFKDPNLAVRQIKTLEAWLESLTSRRPNVQTPAVEKTTFEETV